jgi:hypothetical protein
MAKPLEDRPPPDANRKATMLKRATCSPLDTQQGPVGAGRRRANRCRLSGDSWAVARWSTCQRLLPDLLAVAEHAERLDVVTGGLLHRGVSLPAGPTLEAWPVAERARLSPSKHWACHPRRVIAMTNSGSAAWRPGRAGGTPLLSRASATMPTCRQQGLGCDRLDHPPVTHRLDDEAASAATGDRQDAPSPDPKALHRDLREVPGPGQLEVAPAVLGKALAVE